MRVFRGSHLRLVLAEFPLIFTLCFLPTLVAGIGDTSATLGGQNCDFSGPLDDLCIEFHRNVRR